MREDNNEKADEVKNIRSLIYCNVLQGGNDRKSDKNEV